MNKKGSLELSVNAIVILILAITMLGLGLGFMKGMFGKVSAKVDTAIGGTDIQNPATAENPFVLVSKDATIKRGENYRLDASLFNNLNEDILALEYTTTPPLCKSGLDITTTDFTITVPNPREVKINQLAPLSFLVEVATTATSRTSICTFTVTATTTAGTTVFTQDFFLTVP